MKIFGIAVLALVLLVGLGWALTANDLAMFSFWAPKYKAVERDVYQQTPSYINGNLADLRQMRDSINLTSDPVSKKTLQAALRDKINHLPPDFPVPADVKYAAYND